MEIPAVRIAAEWCPPLVREPVGLTGFPSESRNSPLPDWQQSRRVDARHRFRETGGGHSEPGLNF